MNKRPVVIDVSKYDYDLVPRNIDGIIQRSSYHLTVDQRFEAIGKSIKDVAIRELYHYQGYRTMLPDGKYKKTPWFPQVELILKLLNSNPYTTYQRVWIDAEEDQWGNKFTPQFKNEIGEMLRLVGKEVRTGIYTNRDGYLLLERHLGASFLNQYDLWLADPHENLPLESFNYGNPTWGVYRKGSDGKWNLSKFARPEGSWTYWQVSFKGDPKTYGLLPNEGGYIKKAVDVNVYNGSLYGLYRENNISLTKYVGNKIKKHVLPQMK